MATEKAKGVVAPEEKDEDRAFDQTLRPKKLDEYIGQDRVKQNLSIVMDAAKKRKESIEHVLLHGNPGLGKTTLAHIIAHEMGANIRVTSGPAIERAGDLAAILTNLEAGDVLFIDEIHRLNRSIEEILYPAMEEFGLDLVIGKGPAARTIRLDVPRFTLIGATTRVSLLSSPLRDRFGMIYHLNFYEEGDIEKILERSARILKVKTEPEAQKEIAKRARRTPRIANRLLKRVRDFAQVKHNGVITSAIAKEALNHLEVDEFGLDEIDRRILDVIITKFGGGPVGLTTIAAASGEDVATLEEVYEPFLLQIGFLDRTQRGRVATKLAYEHLGHDMPKEKQSSLL
ncbi:MAG: Holliday junction branch migration DNA helicase RuvB [bacterium]|nr:Holliday junction branch migration DNA helicase RuvB [bacterium]